MVQFPARKVGTIDVPLFSLSVRRENEGSLARPNQQPCTAHCSLLSKIRLFPPAHPGSVETLPLPISPAHPAHAGTCALPGYFTRPTPKSPRRPSFPGLLWLPCVGDLHHLHFFAVPVRTVHFKDLRVRIHKLPHRTMRHLPST